MEYQAIQSHWEYELFIEQEDYLERIHYPGCYPSDILEKKKLQRSTKMNVGRLGRGRD